MRKNSLREVFADTKSGSGGFDAWSGLVIVIVGPTASGKTGVGIRTALEIERELGRKAEIISADSRAVYAEEKIIEGSNRGNVPMVVGGTGLYIDALVYNYQFSEQKSCSDRTEMDERFRMFGIKTETKKLRENIYTRVNKMFVQELFDEVSFLVQEYGWRNQAMKSDIYEYAWKYLEGEVSLEEAKKLCFYEDWHLAKRQMTWFKRNKNISWNPIEKITQSVLKCIQDE